MSTNVVDRVVEYFSPVAAARRRAARTILAHYDAAHPSRLRNFHRERGTQNEIVGRSAEAIRAQARQLARNHDIARGVLRTLVNSVVGPHGIGVEPQPRRADGTIHKEYAADLLHGWREWCQRPEVTHQLSFAKVQRAAVRAWMRDGEMFGQLLQGYRADLDHGTEIPLSLELWEADLVPMSMTDESQRIAQGIERNGWGRPVALHVLKTQPWRAGRGHLTDTKRVPWGRVLHLANRDNIGQMRGVSEFASVITRLEDIKDYEESERVAAKIAAMLTAYIKKGTPDTYAGAGERREIPLQPGTIIDDLMPGEDIDTIDSKRPNPNLITFRQGQLRAVAAGFGTSYSSSSKDYNGTYSAQRQELVEQWVNYAVLADDFVSAFIQPVWQRFVESASLSGVIRMPRDLKPGTYDDALYVAAAMPWIDPVKEALASEYLVKAGFASEVEMIRRRGANPHDVLEQISSWRQECAEKQLVFSSNEAGMAAVAIAAVGGE